MKLNPSSPCGLHPKAVEQRREAALRAYQERSQRAREHYLTAAHKLRFVHVRSRDWEAERKERDPRKMVLSQTGGVTVAYQLPPRKGDRMIRVSCAVVHENDAYCKRIGRWNAAVKFDNGEVISVRVPKNMSPAGFIKQMFGVML